MRKYNELKQMLDTYETEGFDAVVLRYNYHFSRNNLVQLFKKYIPEYVPNTHTKRTRAKMYKE